MGRSASFRQGEAKGIPSSHTFELERGTSVGGVIQDEQGNPIAGVDVACMVPGDGTDGRERTAVWETAKGRSDEQGRWRCDGIHRDQKELSIRVTHTEFISQFDNDFAGKLPIEDLRAMKGVIKLNAQVSLTLAGAPMLVPLGKVGSAIGEVRAQLMLDASVWTRRSYSSWTSTL